MQSAQPIQTTAAAPPARGQWQPLLEDGLRAGALQAVQEIASALPAGLAEEFGVDDPARVAPLQLAELALFYGYLAHTLNEGDAAQQAVRYLNLAFDGLAAQPTSLKLHSGVTGVAWVVANLVGTVLEPEEAENCAGVDELVKRLLARAPWESDYDLISGLVGYGVYALERLPQPAARACLRLVVDRLAELAEHNEQGVTWFTPATLLPDWQRELCPHGYYNLGLAHGVPGVIALLGRLYAAGIERARVKPLLVGAVRWLLAQGLPAELQAASQSRFPSWSGAGAPREAAKLSWCYGDLGAATALLDAARWVGAADWEAEALAILRQAATRPFEKAYVKDACLCHGSAGNAHIFNRIFQATGELLFQEAAQRWFACALAFKQPGPGVAGFPGFWVDGGGEVQWATKTGLLDGAAGIGLALLAACTAVEPQWDRLLLVSLPLA